MMSYWFQQRNSQYSSGSSTSHRPSSSSYRYNDDDDRDDGTSRPLPCSDLWDFILDMDWQRVIEHTKHSPQDAEYLDGHWHETPLYSICQMSDNTSLPVEAVQAIINAYPNAIRIASRSNRDLPIHIACRYQASIEIIKLLVEDYPVTAVEQTRWGKTPLMTLWEFRKHNDTISPMELEEFWEKVHILLKAVAKYRCIANGSTNTPKLKRGRIFGGQQEEEQLEADDEDLSRYIVHAAVSLGSLCCPSDVLQYLLEKYPDQAKTYDPWGYLPLHIAVGPTPWSSIRKTTSSTSSNTTSTSATTTRRRMDTTTTTTTNTRRRRREQQVLQYILQSYPDPWGLLPMQISHTIPNGNNNSNGNVNDMDTTTTTTTNRQPPTPSSPWIVTMMTGRKYKPREQRVLKLLLQSYPDAANERMANDSNRYPLHSAIANRHTWTGGLKELFHAAPHTLLIQDPVTHLFPFQLAAIPVRDTVVELDTVYELLRAQPDVLNLCNTSPRVKSQSPYISSAILRTRERRATAGGFAGGCPPFPDSALFGTVSAILIGSAAGFMFSTS